MNNQVNSAGLKQDQFDGTYMLPAWDSTMYVPPAGSIAAASRSFLKRVLRMTLVCTLVLISAALMTYWLMPATAACTQAPFCL